MVDHSAVTDITVDQLGSTVVEEGLHGVQIRSTKVVQDPDSVSLLHELPAQMGADEASAPSDDDLRVGHAPETTSASPGCRIRTAAPVFETEPRWGANCSVARVTEPVARVFIHETAIVEPGAQIGEGTAIWHHAHVRAGATIGRDCTIGKNVYVDSGVSIGHRVKIQNNVSVYAGVTIGDEVFVGPSAVFTNDLLPRAVGYWAIMPTTVSNGASIGANATIVCGNEIGAYAMVGAGAVVTHSVADHCLVLGNPARPAGWVCRCGAVVSRSMDRPTDLRCPGCR
jgi:acetyltransferase-like isoleucine patch superfamily enzyme